MAVPSSCSLSLFHSPISPTALHSVQETALQLLEKAGQLYLKDHAADMEEMSRYLPRDAQASVGGVETALEE